AAAGPQELLLRAVRAHYEEIRAVDGRRVRARRTPCQPRAVEDDFLSVRRQGRETVGGIVVRQAAEVCEAPVRRIRIREIRTRQIDLRTKKRRRQGRHVVDVVASAAEGDRRFQLELATLVSGAT